MHKKSRFGTAVLTLLFILTISFAESARAQATCGAQTFANASILCSNATDATMTVDGGATGFTAGDYEFTSAVFNVISSGGTATLKLYNSSGTSASTIRPGGDDRTLLYVEAGTTATVDMFDSETFDGGNDYLNTILLSAKSAGAGDIDIDIRDEVVLRTRRGGSTSIKANGLDSTGNVEITLSSSSTSVGDAAKIIVSGGTAGGVETIPGDAGSATPIVRSYGIEAYSGAGSIDVNMNTTSVIAANEKGAVGIYANSTGGGDITINGKTLTTGGFVLAGGGIGIEALTGAGNVDISIIGTGGSMDASDPGPFRFRAGGDASQAAGATGVRARTTNGGIKVVFGGNSAFTMQGTARDSTMADLASDSGKIEFEANTTDYGMQIAGRNNSLAKLSSVSGEIYANIHGFVAIANEGNGIVADSATGSIDVNLREGVGGVSTLVRFNASSGSDGGGGTNGIVASVGTGGVANIIVADDSVMERVEATIRGVTTFINANTTGGEVNVNITDSAVLRSSATNVSGVKARADGGTVNIKFDSTGSSVLSGANSKLISATATGAGVINVNVTGTVGVTGANSILADLSSASGKITADLINVRSTGIETSAVTAVSGSGEIDVTVDGGTMALSSTNDGDGLFNLTSSSGDVKFTVKGATFLSSTGGTLGGFARSTNVVKIGAGGGATVNITNSGGSGAFSLVSSSHGGSAIDVKADSNIEFYASGTASTGGFSTITASGGSDTVAVSLDSNGGPIDIQITNRVQIQTTNTESGRIAVDAYVDRGTSTGTISFLLDRGSEVLTSGADSVAVQLETRGGGDVTATVNGRIGTGTGSGTTGVSAKAGVGARGSDSDDGDIIFSMQQHGDIVAGGANQNGVHLRSGAGDITASIGGGTLSADGAGATALKAESASGDITVTVSGGAQFGRSQDTAAWNGIDVTTTSATDGEGDVTITFDSTRAVTGTSSASGASDIVKASTSAGDVVMDIFKAVSARGARAFNLTTVTGDINVQVNGTDASVSSTGDSTGIMTSTSGSITFNVVEGGEFSGSGVTATTGGAGTIDMKLDDFSGSGITTTTSGTGATDIDLDGFSGSGIAATATGAGTIDINLLDSGAGTTSDSFVKASSGSGNVNVVFDAGLTTNALTLTGAAAGENLFDIATTSGEVNFKLDGQMILRALSDNTNIVSIRSGGGATVNISNSTGSGTFLITASGAGGKVVDVDAADAVTFYADGTFTTAGLSEITSTSGTAIELSSNSGGVEVRIANRVQVQTVGTTAARRAVDAIARGGGDLSFLLGERSVIRAPGAGAGSQAVRLVTAGGGDISAVVNGLIAVGRFGTGSTTFFAEAVAAGDVGLDMLQHGEIVAEGASQNGVHLKSGAGDITASISGGTLTARGAGATALKAESASGDITITVSGGAQLGRAQDTAAWSGINATTTSGTDGDGNITITFDSTREATGTIDPTATFVRAETGAGDVRLNINSYVDARRSRPFFLASPLNFPQGGGAPTGGSGDIHVQVNGADAVLHMTDLGGAASGGYMQSFTGDISFNVVEGGTFNGSGILATTFDGTVSMDLTGGINPLQMGLNDFITAISSGPNGGIGVNLASDVLQGDTAAGALFTFTTAAGDVVFNVTDAQLEAALGNQLKITTVDGDIEATLAGDSTHVWSGYSESSLPIDLESTNGDIEFSVDGGMRINGYSLSSGEGNTVSAVVTTGGGSVEVVVDGGSDINGVERSDTAAGAVSTATAISARAEGGGSVTVTVEGTSSDTAEIHTTADAISIFADGGGASVTLNEYTNISGGTASLRVDKGSGSGTFSPISVAGNLSGDVFINGGGEAEFTIAATGNVIGDFTSGMGREIFINTGTFTGDFDMGAGNDEFQYQSGNFSVEEGKTYELGAGVDTFIVAEDLIFEGGLITGLGSFSVEGAINLEAITQEDAEDPDKALLSFCDADDLNCNKVTADDLSIFGKDEDGDGEGDEDTGIITGDDALPLYHFITAESVPEDKTVLQAVLDKLTFALDKGIAVQDRTSKNIILLTALLTGNDLLTYEPLVQTGWYSIRGFGKQLTGACGTGASYELEGGDGCVWASYGQRFTSQNTNYDYDGDDTFNPFEANYKYDDSSSMFTAGVQMPFDLVRITVAAGYESSSSDSMRDNYDQSMRLAASGEGDRFMAGISATRNVWWLLDVDVRAQVGHTEWESTRHNDFEEVYRAKPDLRTASGSAAVQAPIYFLDAVVVPRLELGAAYFTINEFSEIGPVDSFGRMTVREMRQLTAYVNPSVELHYPAPDKRGVNDISGYLRAGADLLGDWGKNEWTGTDPDLRDEEFDIEGTIDPIIFDYGAGVSWIAGESRRFEFKLDYGGGFGGFWGDTLVNEVKGSVNIAF